MGLLKWLQQSKEAEKLATAESVFALAWGKSKQVAVASLSHRKQRNSQRQLDTPPALAYKASATLNLPLTEIMFTKSYSHHCNAATSCIK